MPKYIKKTDLSTRTLKRTFFCQYSLANVYNRLTGVITKQSITDIMTDLTAAKPTIQQTNTIRRALDQVKLDMTDMTNFLLPFTRGEYNAPANIITDNLPSVNGIRCVYAYDTKLYKHVVSLGKTPELLSLTVKAQLYNPVIVLKIKDSDKSKDAEKIAMFLTQLRDYNKYMQLLADKIKIHKWLPEIESAGYNVKINNTGLENTIKLQNNPVVAGIVDNRIPISVEGNIINEVEIAGNANNRDTLMLNVAKQINNGNNNDYRYPVINPDTLVADINADRTLLLSRTKQLMERNPSLLDVYLEQRKYNQKRFIEELKSIYKDQVTFYKGSFKMKFDSSEKHYYVVIPIVDVYEEFIQVGVGNKYVTFVAKYKTKGVEAEMAAYNKQYLSSRYVILNSNTGSKKLYTRKRLKFKRSKKSYVKKSKKKVYNKPVYKKKPYTKFKKLKYKK